MPWQPIQIAPKNGRPFLAWCDGGPQIVRWLPHYSNDDEDDEKDIGGWASTVNLKRLHPTHWMELPTGPDV